MKNDNGNSNSGIVFCHRAEWSAEEHRNAREQLDEYGCVFVDDLGRPIDDPEGVKCLAETRMAA